MDSACESSGARVERFDHPGRPAIIHIIGSTDELWETALVAGVPFVPELAAALCRTLKPVSASLELAIAEAAPINWEAAWFDIVSRRWRPVDSDAMLRTTTAFEFRPSYGARRYFVRDPRRGLLRMQDRSEAAYAAASFKRIGMLSYDERSRVMFVPIGAPLPAEMARVAAACSGAPPSVAGRHLLYKEVPTTVAGALLAAVGQRPPTPHWIKGEAL
jgi:hypothetical protein